MPYRFFVFYSTVVSQSYYRDPGIYQGSIITEKQGAHREQLSAKVCNNTEATQNMIIDSGPWREKAFPHI